ncbi:hypothetical protein HK101_010792 [Irineochytrium annulatum]|nr:hypothetical protein HK101_010792 [Irineochytrium annulatum]
MLSSEPLRIPEKMTAADIGAFIESFNTAYEVKHRNFENNFWSTKMALNGASSAELTRTKNELDLFLGDAAMMKVVRSYLDRKDLSKEHKKTLELFERTFTCYIIEDKAALDLRSRINELEAELADARNSMKLGYVDPASGEFKIGSSVQLRTMMTTCEDEKIRKACYDGVRQIGPFVSERFCEIIKLRNKLARALGFECFYDMKVTQAEGFGKKRLFEILDDLERSSRGILAQSREKLSASKGAWALEPHNMGYAMAGDISALKDPYFPFESSVDVWARSFAALGISYRGATMNLDLLDRPGKYSNGFCHWPQPAWKSESRGWVPSRANFTSLATPGQVGSGLRALETLMHEGGHAAHFANVSQPSPLYAQERAPTSIAYAENQSMFLDSLVHDASWLGRYALNRDGDVIPWDLIEKDIRATHDYAVFALRGMLAVPFFERRLYDLEEADVTPENILKIADEVEHQIQGGLAGRPLMSVPHILADESSGYYHGYVMAEMSVHQTRAHFIKKYGEIVDNPQVGEDLNRIYWACGNSRMFLDLVREMTGRELSGDAWVSVLTEGLEERLSREKVAYEAAITEGPKFAPGDAKVDLDMKVMFVHGDEVIASSDNGGLQSAIGRFREWIRKTYA